MENEVSKTVDIAVALVGLSALISLILVVANLIGFSLKDTSNSGAENITSSMTKGYVSEIASNKDIENIPASTAYSIILTNKDRISTEVSGYDDVVRDLSEDDSVLKNNLKGRVKLELVPTGSEDYTAIINILDDKGNIANKTENAINTIPRK